MADSIVSCVEKMRLSPPLNSKLASRFVRVSLDHQRLLAAKVKELRKDCVVYVFAESSYFDDAEDITIAGVRAKIKDKNIAVLSVSAQLVFPTVNTYLQYTSDPKVVSSDNIGVFLI